jgi:hypothetical protein
MQVTQVEAQLPVLDLSPNPVTDGQVTVLGKNFCGEAGCSNVTIVVEERVAASDVAVIAVGTFEITFAVTERAGMYLVTATQTLADGRILRAEASMAVPTRDHEVIPIPSPIPSPTSPPAPTSGASPTSTRPPSEASPTPPGPATASSPTPTGGANGRAGAGNGGDGWVLPLILALVLLAILAGVVGLWLRRSRESKTS